MMSEEQQIDRTPTDEEVEAIKEWLRNEPHLPNVMSDILIKRFINSCKYDMQITKKTIDLYYTIRHNTPEIFSNRDPLLPEIKNAFEIAYMCPLPKPTAENYKLFLYKMENTNPDVFDFNISTKAFLMLADARLNGEQHLYSGEVPIFDMTGVSLRYVTKLVYSTLRKYMQYTQEAHPVTLKQIHVINTLPYVDKLFNIVKPLMKSEVMQMVHFHGPDSETLYKFVPKELLPFEYGGEAGKLEDIREYWIKEVDKMRDFYLDESLWKVDESKRLSQKDRDMNGTFKSLSID